MVLFSGVFCLSLLLNSGAALVFAAPEFPFSGAAIRYTVLDSQRSVESKCVGTAVEHHWLISAAHCVKSTTATLFAPCPQDEKEQGSPIAIQNIVFHKRLDLVLIELEKLPLCVTTIAITDTPVTENTVFHTVDSVTTPTTIYKFDTLKQDGPTAVLRDESACLSRGDSGYPLFTDSDSLLAGILIAGTQDCPAYQQVVKLAGLTDWIKSVVTGVQRAGE